MKRRPIQTQKKMARMEKETKKGIPEISKANSDLILAYLSDMEMGRNRVREVLKGKSTK
jgi:hypothetical protein